MAAAGRPCYTETVHCTLYKCVEVMYNYVLLPYKEFLECRDLRCRWGAAPPDGQFKEHTHNAVADSADIHLRSLSKTNTLIILSVRFRK